MTVILASTSPRRHVLLSRLGIPFTVLAGGLDERPPRVGEAPQDYAVSLAREKASLIGRQHPSAYVIGADTVVAVDGQILGKPVDATDAERMLRLLSGRCHDVVTGVALAGVANLEGFVTARVCMRPYTREEASTYVATGEPMDKAGAYAVQEYGGTLVSSVTGCCEAVVGLPLCLTQELLRRGGFSLPLPLAPQCTHRGAPAL